METGSFMRLAGLASFLIAVGVPAYAGARLGLTLSRSVPAPPPP
jgi:hypothetical protein